MTAALVLWLAIAYRVRGHRPDGGVLRTAMHPVLTLRPLWSASVFGVVYLLTGDLWIAGAVAVGEWIGLHIPHARGQDMGTWKGSILEDVAFMAGVGALRGWIVAGCLAYAMDFAAPIDTLLMLVAGYAFTLPLSYFLGWRIPFRVPHILRGGIEWSEFLAGASRALVFVLVFGA